MMKKKSRPSLGKRLLKFLIWTVGVVFVLFNFLSATHAYKFTHFYDYQPNKGPVLLSEGGWQKMEDLVFGKDYEKKPNIARPDSFTDVILTTPDHLKLRGWYRVVPHAAGTVELFHGYGENRTDVLPQAMAFAAMGYNVFLIDFRAHGNSDGHTTTIGDLEAGDVKLAYDFIRQKGEKNIVLWGFSMGAASIAHAIAEYDLHPNKVILEMPFATMEQAVEGQVRLMHLPTEPLGTLLTFWGGIEHGFWAFSINPEEYVRKIHCPVLLQQGAHDIRVTPDQTQEIFAHLNQPKQLVIYQQSGHESLLKKERMKWLTTVASFLNS
ncbi:MAG: alpha/beta fold hydrolase [Bacteroidota bacterium]|nr:alpha/beta fold hydrolase [Bacteroidota bacterium]